MSSRSIFARIGGGGGGGFLETFFEENSNVVTGVELGGTDMEFYEHEKKVRGVFMQSRFTSIYT